MSMVKRKTSEMKSRLTPNLGGVTTKKAKILLACTVLSGLLLIICAAIGIYESEKVDLDSGVVALAISLAVLPFLSFCLIAWNAGCLYTWFFIISAFMAAAVGGLISSINKTRSDIGTKYCKDGGNEPPLDTNWNTVISCQTGRDYLDGALVNYWIVLAAIIFLLIFTLWFNCNRTPADEEASKLEDSEA